MGYRSEVAMVIKAKDESAFREFCLHLKLFATAEMGGVVLSKDLWADEDEVGFTEDSIIFHVSNVKWYEDFPEVIRMDKLWQFASDYEDDKKVGLSGTFYRIGEEDADIEGKCFGDDPPYEEIQLCRYIEVCVSPKTTSLEEVIDGVKPKPSEEE
jgi:hypothetical protein